MGKKKYPNNAPTIFKSIFKVQTESDAYSESFQKHIFEPIHDAKYLIIHLNRQDAILRKQNLYGKMEKKMRQEILMDAFCTYVDFLYVFCVILLLLICYVLYLLSMYILYTS